MGIGQLKISKQGIAIELLRDLKGCPFCGSDCLGYGKADQTMAMDDARIVYCLDCGAEGPFKTSENKARLAWNGRVDGRERTDEAV